MSRLAAFAFLLAAATAHARSIDIRPAAPTSATPLSVTITADVGDPCKPDPLNATILRSGATITIDLGPRARVCPATTNPWTTTLEMPPVPAGDYTVLVNVDGQRYTRTRILVRDASPQFHVRPFAVTPGTRVMLEGIAIDARSEVFVDGVRARIEGDRVVMPQHAPGLVEVRVGSIPSMAYYLGGNDEPAGSLYERILFPILTRTAGAFGSRWTTETAIHNGNPWTVTTRNAVAPIVCVQPPCTEEYRPFETLRFDGGAFPRGVALLVPRDAVPRFSYSLRVRDTNREQDDFGSRIPVAREADFRTERFPLLDVPLRENYRVRLRLYSFEPKSDRVDVSTAGAAHTVTLQPGADAAQPAFAEVDVTALFGTRGNVDLTIQPLSGTAVWAFATVTNNTTQRVTVIAPN
jgi:hypothetical protein